MMSSSESNKFVFTASQWQELKHQALAYNHMVSGIPIPSDLLFTIRRSLESSSSSLCSSSQLNQPPHMGWSGFGRKVDPEPGRCRRTDGKKWRCSKEAYPDSKYCERHMHRGRNRSRKPVELVLSSNAFNSTNDGVCLNAVNINNDSPHLSSTRPRGLLGLSSSLQDSSQSHASGKDCSRNNNSIYYGGSSVNDSVWKLTPLTMGTSSLSYQMIQSKHSSDFHDMHMTINDGEREDDQPQPKKVMQLFLDEWQPKDKDDDSDDKTSSRHMMHDFFMTQK